jgi:hypothetical protein
VAQNNPAYSSVNGVLFDKGQDCLIQYPNGLGGSYTIPNSVTNIVEDAFNFCVNLTSVTIPASLTNIGYSPCILPFYFCTSLRTITVAQNNPAYTSVNGVLFDKGKDELIQYPGGLGGSYTIPNTVTGIESYAFSGCPSLTSVTIPASVWSIGCYVFYYSTSLTYVCFEGNQPFDEGDLFDDDSLLSTIYYVSGTTGWGSTYDGIPTEPCAQCPGVTITGNVYEGCGGLPVSGASVQIGNYSATSTSEGGYSISGIQPGTYMTTVTANNYISVTNTVTIHSSVQTVTNDFTLSPFLTVTGQIYDGCGNFAISGAFIQIGTSTTISDNTGAYIITNLQSGTYIVTVSQSNYITVATTLTISSCPPTITTNVALYSSSYILSPPANETVAIGQNATFTVTTACFIDGYQWQFNGTSLSDNGHITGSKTNVLTINNVSEGDAGTYNVIVSNPSGSTNTSAILTVITRATEVLRWSTPAPILYGTPLSSTQLNATANVPGSFSYTPTNGAVLNAGTHTLSVIFIPNDTVDYSSLTNTVSLVVSQASLAVTANSTNRPYGQTNPVLTGVITGLTNGDNITATYGCGATSSSPVGTYPIVPSLVDPNDRQTNYTVSLVDGTLTVTNYPEAYTFITLAGKGRVSGTNDGTGTMARFYGPNGVAVDDEGNVYVADRYNYTIREVTPTGVVTTLAGLARVSGTNDGTGSAARFKTPTGVAVDGATNLYVADITNNTIREVTPIGTNWVVTTLAGQPGVAGTNDGIGNAARFYRPNGVAVDADRNVYVADAGNHTIRELMPVGTNWVVTTLAGLAGSSGSANGTNSAARFNNPTSVAVDSAGNVYVTDWENSTIREVTPVGTNWVVATLAGLAGSSGGADGIGSAARFYNPCGVAVDEATNLYVADQNNNMIRELMPTGTNWVVTTLGGLAKVSGTNDGTGSAASFDFDAGVTVDSAGNVYVADVNNDTIRRGFLAGGAPVILTNGTSLAMSNGLFGFNLTAAAGQPVVVDASTDLVTWLSIWTNTVGPGVLPFCDPQCGAYSNRFYRAHLP